ncbi:prepilin-type N-terminal cleavage/methylation domain-containing protein [Candidatus Thioglobus sp.]|nr:prepilin-type N-terminal cleavage/methylation domain-containing protein [Candidatus Thioglobus sp.]
MRHNKKAFTLVEMLVALAVSAVIVSATYASFELIKNQYKKNIDVTQLHTSGRAIMQVLEREIRMAGYEFRDDKGLMTYGKIVGPIVITDSGNKCCDEVTIIYDEVTDTLNAQGVVTSSIVDRIKTRFWTEAYSSTKRGSRFRLYKRRTVLGTNNAVLATPRVGAKEVMADYIEDLQLSNTSGFGSLYASDHDSINVYNLLEKKYERRIMLTSSGGAPSTCHNGSIDIGSNGLIYAINWHNMKYAVGIINPKTASISFINTPGASNRYCEFDNPGIGIASDGNIYVNTRDGKVDVYDINTNLLLKTITPSQTLKNLVSNRVDTNSNGIVCSAKQNKTGVTCSNGSSFGNLVNSKNTSLKFITDDEIALSAGENKSDINIYNISTKKKTGVIKLGLSPQNSSARTGGLASSFKIKTLATVDIVLSLRSKEKYGKNRQVDKKDYHSGNFIFSKNDQYQRDTFSTTVSVRNL